MAAYLCKAFFGYRKHDVDEYTQKLQDQVSELVQKNESLSAEIRRLDYKNADLVSELEVKNEILKVRKERGL